MQQGWTITLEAAGDEAAELDGQLDELVELLDEYSGVVSASPDGTRYGATFSLEGEDDAAVALSIGEELFRRLAEKADLPRWPIVRAEVMTWREQDAELATPVYPELVGVTEIARELGLTRQRVSALAKSPDFPNPIAKLASGPVWTRPSLNRFVEHWERRPGRPSKKEVAEAVEALRETIRELEQET